MSQGIPHDTSTDIPADGDAVENPSTAADAGEAHRSSSFDEGKPYPADLVVEAGQHDPQKFPQAVGVEEWTAEAKLQAALAGRERAERLGATAAGTPESQQHPGGSAVAAAESNVDGLKTNPGGESTAGERHDPESPNPRPREAAIGDGTLVKQALAEADAALGTAPRALGPETAVPGLAAPVGEPTAGRGERLASLPDRDAAQTEYRMADGWRATPGQDGLGPNGDAEADGAEPERTAWRLEIDGRRTGSVVSRGEEGILNQFDRSIFSTSTGARILDAAGGDAGLADSPDAPRPAGDDVEIGFYRRPAALAMGDSVSRIVMPVQVGGDGSRQQGGEGALETGRPLPGLSQTSVMQNTPSQNAPPGALARAGLPLPGAAQAEGPVEPSGRFVRAATLANELGAQRINVLMQDDQLGRISLRMVDRAGLIQAVVRTDGGRAAQVLTESLPALMESLTQRGLPSSWTSAQGQGSEQQNDPRQGQPRRYRQPGGQGSGSGGRRPGRETEAVFRVEVR